MYSPPRNRSLMTRRPFRIRTPVRHVTGGPVLHVYHYTKDGQVGVADFSTGRRYLFPKDELRRVSAEETLVPGQVSSEDGLGSTRRPVQAEPTDEE